MSAPLSSIPAPVPRTRLPVLVVDDEDAVRELAVRVLGEAGYEVHTAEDGLAALEIVRRGTPLRVIVSDIVMPRLNGIDLLEALTTAGVSIPFLFMSGYGAADLAHRGLVAPCGVLCKPFTPDQLLAEIERCIEAAA
jgi:CheY-like chemotaxis protein